MKRVLPVFLAVLGAATVGAETVDEVVAANAAARGGLAAWRAIGALTMAGRMDVGRGMQVPFRLDLKRPRKMRLEFTFAGHEVVQTYDGNAGWKLMPFLGRSEPVAMTEDELKVAAGQVDLDGILIDYQAKGIRLEAVGREVVDGRDTVKLKATLANGEVRHVYVDAESHLEVKVVGTRSVRGEDRALTTWFRDYKPVAGLVLPYVVESIVEGAKASQRMVIESVQIDPRLDEARFGRPLPAPPPAPSETATIQAPAGANGARP
jgi:hypothetical protein